MGDREPVRIQYRQLTRRNLLSRLLEITSVKQPRGWDLARNFREAHDFVLGRTFFFRCCRQLIPLFREASMQLGSQRNKRITIDFEKWILLKDFLVRFGSLIHRSLASCFGNRLDISWQFGDLLGNKLAHHHFEFRRALLRNFL